MHPSTEQILRFFEYEHLPQKLQNISRPFCELAHAMAAIPESFDVPSDLTELATTELDGPELTVALRKLLEAKDAAVRAAL